MAEHRCTRVDRGRLPVSFAGHAHPAPLSQVLGRGRLQGRARRDETAEEEEKTKQTSERNGSRRSSSSRQ